MTKWKCSKYGCMLSPCLFETGNEKMTPCLCPLSNQKAPNWVKQEEPAPTDTTTDTLPKLTAEVFDRPDCPKWANYAAVDANGYGYWYEENPGLLCTGRGHGSKVRLIGRFNTCVNSFIERPEKKTLPDWCKVGEWVYAICYFSGESDYYKIREIKPGADTILEIEGHGADYLVWGNHIKQARLRPWTFEEAPSVLKVKDPHGSALAYLSPFGGKYVIAYHLPDKYEGLKLGETTFTFSAFADIFTQIDGSPCGVLEHLENGEWKA